MLNKVKSLLSGKNNIIKISFLSVAIFFAAASLSLAQDSTMNMDNMNMGNMKMDMKEMHADSGKMDSNMKMDSSKKMDMKENHSSPVEYKGVIDLKSIDDNKDGKVYQCPMDFNVLSDKPGIDPKCGMKLKEVSLEQAKKNLTKHGYKVK